jgi:hypothetical protein
MELNITQEMLKQNLNTLTNILGKDCVILSKEVAQYISKLLELQNIPSQNSFELQNIPSQNSVEQVRTIIPELSKEEAQLRRDEVHEMIQKKRPKEGIPSYEGFRSDGDPASFFKKHYKRYIIPGQELIFSSDLGKIDPKLLSALRNNCISDKMPLGTISDKTSAIIERRFFDGVMANSSARKIGLLRVKEEIYQNSASFHKK